MSQAGHASSANSAPKAPNTGRDTTDRLPSIAELLAAPAPLCNPHNNQPPPSRLERRSRFTSRTTSGAERETMVAPGQATPSNANQSRFSGLIKLPWILDTTRLLQTQSSDPRPQFPESNLRAERFSRRQSTGAGTMQIISNGTDIEVIDLTSDNDAAESQRSSQDPPSC